MYEESGRKYRKSLHFETSGETVSVEIPLDNIRPETDISIFFSYAETLFEELMDELAGGREERNGEND